MATPDWVSEDPLSLAFTEAKTTKRSDTSGMSRWDYAVPLAGPRGSQLYRYGTGA